MSMQSYVAHLREELIGTDRAIHEAEQEHQSADGSRRIELAGQLAVLAHRRRRIADKLHREEGHTTGLWRSLRAEFDLDFGTLAEMVERHVVSH